MSAYILPCIIAFILIYGVIKRVDVFGSFTEGAREGLRCGVNVLPSLVLLMCCIGMFKASGALDLLSAALSPVAELFHIPTEIVPLGLIRPISGSGGLALYESILRDNGADSLTGRIASVMMGASETTFFTISLYYGSVKIKSHRHTLFSALLGDLAVLIVSSITVSLIYG